MRYKLGKHCAFNINYHIVWCPKRRSAVLVGSIAEDAKRILFELANKFSWKIEALEVMPDHIHVFISADPRYAPHQIVKALKGATSNYLRKTYPHLLKLPALWSSSYFCSTVGHVSETVVKSYIEAQKGK
jgi:putative transposase